MYKRQSYSGETDDVNKLIPSLKNFGNKIIALTSNKNSTLARHADYVLDITVEREVCPNNLAPTTSALVTLALGDALAVSLITARHFQPADFADVYKRQRQGNHVLHVHALSGKQHDFMAQTCDFEAVVRYQHTRHALPLDFFHQHGDQNIAQIAVQTDERLVQQGKVAAAQQQAQKRCV